MDLGRISAEWEGWQLQEGELLDPVGNRYRPDDLRAVHWIRQAWAARAGYRGELAFLRDEAIRRRDAADRPWIVTIQRETAHGREHQGELRLGSSGPVLVTLDLSPMDGKRLFQTTAENSDQAIDSAQEIEHLGNKP
jgi:hypothetical protein